MNEKETILQDDLKRETKARLKAEQLSSAQIMELYELNKKLEAALAEQKKISARLQQRTKELASQVAKTEDERSAKSTLESILESSIDYSIIALDLEGNIEYWNKGAQNNYGYETKEVVHKKNIRFLHLAHDVESGRVERFFETAYRTGKAEEIFERVRKDRSQFTASVYLALLRNEMAKPTGYVLISKDITKAKRMEAQLLKSNQELEQFAYIASHDLKAPLRAIDRLATWIEEDNIGKLDEQSVKNLHLLRQRINRMSNLIEGILQYSRAGRVDTDIHLVNTSELIKEVVDTINPGKFTVHCAENMPTFSTAKVPLSQVFLNLISNSIKHHHKKEPCEVHISFEDLGDWYKFIVRDNGPGIEPLYFDKIFQIFQTLKSRDEIEATGIGLSIVKKIVESQGGHVDVESIVDKGTTFCFTWPKYSRSLR